MREVIKPPLYIKKMEKIKCPRCKKTKVVDNGNLDDHICSECNVPMKPPSNSFFIPNDDSIRLETRLKDRFRVLLNRIGRSQNWLADEVEISRATMSHIVNKEWFPASDIMIRICEVLDCQAPALFGDSKHWKIWNDKIIYKKEEEK